MTANTPDSGSLRRRIALVLALLALTVTTGGCYKPLFPANTTRTQFDTYDQVRNQHEPDYFFDEYGRKTPNLRGRLSPK